MAKLNLGDRVTEECTDVGNLSIAMLSGSGLILSRTTGSGVTSRGKLLLASRREDYETKFEENELTTCGKFDPSFGKLLRLSLKTAIEEEECSGPIKFLITFGAGLVNPPEAGGWITTGYMFFEWSEFGFAPNATKEYAGETWRLHLVERSQHVEVPTDFCEPPGSVFASGTVGPNGEFLGLPSGFNFPIWEAVDPPAPNYVCAAVYAEVTCNGVSAF